MTALSTVQVRYVRRETLISVAINAVLSALFCLAIFGGRDAIDARALVLDAVPQSFMIALMTTIVPTLITRSRLRSGSVEPLPREASILPANLAVRALAVAVAAALFGVLLNFLLLRVAGIDQLAFKPTLAWKITYGALLAFLLAPTLIRRALADGVANG